MNRQKSIDTRDAYYREAASWAEDRQDRLRTSRRIAWIVAGVAAAIALVEAVALMALAPLKTVVPYTLLVDRQTGFVQALKPLDVQQISGDRALTQSFLVQYVIAREGFDRSTVQADYNKVALWSAGVARSGYIAAMQVNNAESPLNIHRAGTTVATRVKSVSPVGENTALVRFQTERRDANGAVRPLGDWVAVIAYRFTGEPMKVEDRFINPLGFQVMRYRKDAEALPPSQPPEPAPAAKAAAPATR